MDKEQTVAIEFIFLHLFHGSFTNTQDTYRRKRRVGILNIDGSRSSHDLFCSNNVCLQQIPVTGRSKVWVCGRSFAGIAGSNPTAGMDVCLLWVLCVVR
jgi:hypothetical protein